MGHHVLDSPEPEQLPGAPKPVSCKVGPSGVVMSALPVFVGIDVAKAQLDIAVRPSGERWAVANDASGIAALVADDFGNPPPVRRE